MNKEAAIVERIESFVRNTMQIMNDCQIEQPFYDTRLFDIYPRYLKNKIMKFDHPGRFKPYVWEKFKEVIELINEIDDRKQEWL